MNAVKTIATGGTAPVAVPLEVLFSPAAEIALARTGRTEDIRFSPDNRRLALAGFAANSCFVFDISIDVSHELPLIRITDFIEIRALELVDPHGFDFIGTEKLVVANRGGGIEIFNLPPGNCGGLKFELTPMRSISHANLLRKLRNPGSVCVASMDNGKVELLACDNYRRRVTCHVVDLKSRFRLPDNRVLLTAGLDIPDGIALSPDGRWIAVSNHNTANVLVYDRSAPLTPRSAPVGRLNGVLYPHGLRFAADGKRIYVADAGAPRLHIYSSEDADWSGDRAVTQSVGVMDEQTFLKGHDNIEEGGPKGLDIDASGAVLAVTSEHMPLAMFHIPDLFSS